MGRSYFHKLSWPISLFYLWQKFSRSFSLFSSFFYSLPLFFSFSSFIQVFSLLSVLSSSPVIIFKPLSLSTTGALSCSFMLELSCRGALLPPLPFPPTKPRPSPGTSCLNRWISASDHMMLLKKAGKQGRKDRQGRHQIVSWLTAAQQVNMVVVPTLKTRIF